MRWALVNINIGYLFRGAETATDELASALSRRGHDVTVYQGGPALPRRRYRVRRLPLQWRDQSGYRAGDFALGTRVVRALRVRGANAGFFAWNAAAAAAIALDGADVVMPMNGILGQIRACRVAARLHRARLVYLGGNGAADALALDGSVDVYVVPARAWQPWVRARARAAQRIACVPHGVDTARFSPDGPRDPVIERMAAPRFLAVGALADVKRLDLAIAGIARLGRGSLTIVGDGYLRERLVELGRARLGDRFQLIPESPYDSMPARYRSADALVFPSASEERYGIVLLEAMASGIPVVATDDDVRREIVGDAGILCDPHDEAALAAALDRAVDGTLADRPRRRALAQSWDEVAARYEALATDA